MIDIEGNKTKFVNLLGMTSRPGAVELIGWLEHKTDFFTAPASTKYHLHVEGGLCEHSIHVFERLWQLRSEAAGHITDDEADSIAIIGLLHDLCKVNIYKKKAAEDEFYYHENLLPLGHGEKSLYIASQFIKLSTDEALAIRWHMGFSDSNFKAGGGELNKALKQSQWVALAHIADMQATYMDEWGM